MSKNPAGRAPQARVSYTALEDFSHDPELAAALGNMVVAWAHAEIMLFATFARAAGIGLNMAMEALNRIPTFESRVKFVRALVGEWKTDKFDTDDIIKAVDKLAKLAATRNGWVHGDWCSTKDKRETVIFNHRVHPTSADRRKPVKAADVLNHCAAVRTRYRHLGDIIKYRELEG